MSSRSAKDKVGPNHRLQNYRLGSVDVLFWCQLWSMAKFTYDMRYPDQVHWKILRDSVGMKTPRKMETPMTPNFPIISGNGPNEDQERSLVANQPYRALIGYFLHISRHTRPDIPFSVLLLYRYVQDSTLHCWTAAKRILHYLNGTSGD